MCGIAVILPGSSVEHAPFAIDRMTSALRHRGPDEQGIERLAGCDLGHTRLSIIDPDNGQQPMADPSGRYWVVFNGEIYNHLDLRRELEREGFRFRTDCDTEILLYLYARDGQAMVGRLNGQFAFAIWDSVEQTLFLARDRFGEKPLFYARTPGGHLLVASEIKAILATGLLRPRIDLLSVDAYLGLFYVPPDRTIYSNIFTLPPAHSAVVRAEQVQLHRYWTPRFSHARISEDDAVREIRRLLAAAVRRQMVADVPVGAFLSGGLDSSTIVALMSAQQSSTPLRTFAAGFGDLINELPFARDVADQYETNHHERPIDIDVAAMLDRMSSVYDEPFADSSNIPTYLISEQAREHVKVVLSGDGGDELFGGYEWYKPLLEPPRMDHPLTHADRHLKGATGALSDRGALWGERNQPAAGRMIRQYYGPRPGVNGIDQATAIDIACYLPGDILTKVDRAAMAHGLETRCPFLDTELADFVLSLPWEMRFGNGTLKHLLRQACEHLWPAAVRSRPKQGFGAPVRDWLRHPAVHAKWEKVTSSHSPLCALLPSVGSLLNELRPQQRWTLLCLGQWLERRTECLAGLS